MPVSLEQILTSTRQSLSELRGRRAALERDIALKQAAPSFREALRRSTVAVIAEVKRRSPSAGSIREDLDPGERAALYASHGAAAISVLTDGPYFGGSVDDLRAAAERCGLPVLRKDFILDEVQILEARAAGASAVLLIVRVLGAARLEALLRYSTGLGLDALVEVHTGAELEAGIDAGAEIIGVNSRDLDTFRIHLEESWDLLARIPGDRVAVAESGIHGQSEIRDVAAAGADAVLIGTALSAAAEPERLLTELTGVPRRGR